ncbi:hypothetical protein GCM10027417_13140 [Glutamicibacter endophyticus]
MQVIAEKYVLGSQGHDESIIEYRLIIFWRTGSEKIDQFGADGTALWW